MYSDLMNKAYIRVSSTLRMKKRQPTMPALQWALVAASLQSMGSQKVRHTEWLSVHSELFIGALRQSFLVEEEAICPVAYFKSSPGKCQNKTTTETTKPFANNEILKMSMFVLLLTFF